ncbi:acyl-CoA dehydrogenase [Paenibacillus antri]|uniref:Acyl-CoA dehydrogenase n=1 Tax=Paenibacillus antri TaxID=2582848 RepID=A0A5R9GDD2_9BACL|nr:acyl-CoA dehydrogenase family protein [Paenibacillus antri]TLS52100.1 acyl-CoA dehydrogenase [Paenibacillus antri]
MSVSERNLKPYLAGGGFIIDDAPPEAVATPEDFTEEQRMFAETTRDFIESEVLPHDERLEKLNYELTVKLMRKAGELGLLGADVPEAYGGLGLDKISSTIINENLAKASSFALSIGAHVGIGTLPIVFFGSKEQKEKYLPALATGEKIAAYCLTEPASGSDALGAKTTARLSSDGKHYILNGSKIYITNGGFADVYIVYAKIDGTDFSAFILERGMEGFTTGPEEKKMGIKGSSTVPLYFEDVHVPVENLLGEPGRGHVIAFNILNIGRFKLAAGTVGACKESIALSAAYANTRQQFGRPISSFPLIGAKLADMNVRTYALESMVYRTAGLINDSLAGLDYNAPDAGRESARGIAEYAIECSINKVFASEALDFVADEGVQIHGGYGYVQEYKIERIYRDSRINRIFEGTNEINRMLIPGTLLKKALKGELPLLQKAQEFQSELLSFSPPASFEGALEQEAHLVRTMKKIFLLVGGAAVQKYGMNLEKEQEALSALADVMILAYAAESALLRTKKRIAAAGEAKAQLAILMTRVYAQEAFDAIEGLAKRQLAAMEEGDALRTMLSALKKLARHQPINATALKREIAARVVDSEKYVD